MTFELIDSTLVIADSTPIAATTANQTLISIPIPENHYKYIQVHIDLEIALVTSPVVQQVDLELINDATVVKTFNFSPGAVDVLGIVDYLVEWVLPKNNQGNIILQLGNVATADPDVSYKVKGAWCVGIS